MYDGKGRVRRSVNGECAGPYAYPGTEGFCVFHVGGACAVEHQFPGLVAVVLHEGKTHVDQVPIRGFVLHV